MAGLALPRLRPDRQGSAIALDADHRRHAVCELAIRDLKDGAGLRHCPSAPHTVMFGLGVLVVAIWRGRSAARAAPAAA